MSGPILPIPAAIYRDLARGLRDMIDAGRLQEAMVPDDFQWLTHVLNILAANDRETEVDDEYVRTVNASMVTDIHGEFTFGESEFRDPESKKWAIFDIDGDRVIYVDARMVCRETLAMAWSVWNVAKEAGEQLGKARHQAQLRQLLGL